MSLNSAIEYSTTRAPFAAFAVAAVVAAGAACSAFADSASDSAIRMEEVGVAVFGHPDYQAPTAAYPTAASGTRADDANAAPSATSATASWSLAAWSVGRMVSEQPPDAKVGEFLTRYPCADDDIDWTKTYAAIKSSQAFADGGIQVIGGTTNVAETLLITRSGAMEIPFVLKDGTQVSSLYTFSAATSKRPYRLFATRRDEGNGAAFIDLSGRFVRFFGDPAVITPRYETNSAGTSNVVWGLDYDPATSHMLTARYLVDESTGEIDCPKGQFVLGYYDTETKDRLVASIVVEITPPAVNTLSVTVGSELRPVGGGWDVADLQGVANNGIEVDSDDPYSPYLEKFSAPSGQELSNAFHGKIYAIAPTDKTTSGTLNMAMPWKADVYWKTSDPMGVMWTFENDWYLVSWPSDAHRLVISDNPASPGLAMAIPTNYVSQVLGYKAPTSLTAQLNSSTGALTVNGEGKFLIKLVSEAQDRPWYLPMTSRYRTNPEVLASTSAGALVADWPIGFEVTMFTGAAAGTAESAASLVDGSLSGYIYAPASAGRNWNPRLYHEPTAGSASGLSADALSQLGSVGGQTTTETDPYAALESSIYGVNESASPVEVWWRGAIQLAGMPTPIPYPGLVERYRFTWTETLRDGLLPEIALSSKLGSADPAMRASGGRSLAFADAAAYASVNGTVPLAGAANTVDFQLRAFDSALGTATGRVATVTSGGSSFAISLKDFSATNLVFASALDGAEQDVCEIARGGGWTEVAFTLPAGWAGTRARLLLGAADGERAAGGFALDDFAVRCFDETGTNATDAVRFLFAATDLEPAEDDAASVRVAADASGHGYQLRADGFAVGGRGSPRAFDGTLAAADGVDPEIYYQNASGSVGYNPNEEHAFLKLDGDYVVWAMRNDLNAGDTSEPVVLAQFAKDGKGAMQAYRVVTSSLDHPSFTNAVVAGSRMVIPGPVGKVDGAESRLNAYSSLYSFDDANVVYVDRKGTAWARRDGAVTARYGYPLQDGFYCPSLGDAQLETGTVVGWMNCVGVPNPSAANLRDVSKATPWNWVSQWPATNGVPTMKVAQVLTKATGGLPDVWNASSMAIAYPNPAASSDADAPTVVELIDPTVAQTAALPIDGDFTGEYGFTLGSSGTCFLRKGKYHFTRLPPSISDRFYVDTNADAAKRMNLVGQLVEKESGGSYLELNVLSDAERRALKAICPETATRKADWDAAVDALATACVLPSVRQSTAPALSECRSDFNYIFPSKKARDKWIAYVENNAVPLMAADGVHYAVTSTNGPAYAEGVTPVATRVELTNDYKRHHGLRTRQKDMAKRYYDLSGLAEILGEWDDLTDGGTTWDDIYYVSGYFSWQAADSSPSTAYAPQDHYALVANGSGAGWVTLIENDNDDESAVNPGLPVSMHVIRVEPTLYLDGIAVVSDPLNKLSEKLTLLYRTPLGPAADDYEFEWKYATPYADGTLAADKASAAWTDKTAPAVQAGLTSLQLGESSDAQDYVNTYYAMRYRAKEGTLAAATVGTDWSGWTDEQLAEGWVQRVLNSVTPFAQRVEDFYSNPSDISYTMLEQIGGPYRGDVALNNDSLSEVGLLELYQTIFNKAESILVASGGGNVDLSKQLMLATTRMGEFYSLLGAEAYSDAKNPLVASSTDEPTAAGVFCFANQVPTLLDEELALLRGRTSATQFPKMTAEPCYNRLLWNFTKGVTEGEAAYVANYGIRARDGVMDVNCAAAQYPQGHGDAWGHYLSALTGYYRLLRNPAVDWTASMTEMLMDQTTVNVDYQDEAKFADAAVKLAQVGCDAVALTARKAYKENAGDLRSGYFDADREQAFGYGEWATRTGMGAAYNWMVANAITPTTNEAAAAFADTGLKRIDREQNGAQMKVLCRTVEDLQRTLSGFEGGLNPLGLSENVVPFDIDPDALAEKSSHFEQILERTEKALDNCKTVLDWANVYGSRLAQIQADETAATEDVAKQELAYENQLIAIYGTPFSGDIGVGGTYPQGYEGPDIYNYNYMDLSVFGLESGMTTVFTNSYVLYEAGLYGYRTLKLETGYQQEADMTVTLNYVVSDGGIRMKPANVTGVRATEGTIQSAYRDYIAAYQKLQTAMATYQVKVAILELAWASVKEAYGRTSFTMAQTLVPLVYSMAYHMDADHWVEVLQTEFDFAIMADDNVKDVVANCMGAGTTVVTDPSSLKAAAELPAKMTETYTAYQALLQAQNFAYLKQGIQQSLEGIFTMAETAWSLADSFRELESKMQSTASEVNDAAAEIQSALAELTTAEAAYRQEVHKGQLLQEERELWRQQVSNTATQQRYLDMFNRVQRNNALVKYSTSFDTAQRYVFELAKVYDYETGLLSSDAQSGKQFLADVVATRALGTEGLVTSSGTTDGGLWDVVTRMKSNWGVLKGRLGVNNPDKPEKWFSLRYELFRIKPDASGDEAWRRELRKCWVDDIRANADYARYCQPLQSENDSPAKEPGLVIEFATSINNAENFFGRTLQGGESQFSSADYATKIAAVGVDFAGYDKLTTQTAAGLATEPNIYLVPVGADYMRAPAGTTRKVLSWNVVDQVMPLPYTVGSTELDDELWFTTMSGLDGTSDSAATIRRHSTLRTGGDFKSTRLVGRSVWNDRWILVIPASSLNADRERALETFINGVGDIKLGIKAYSRQGN